ncbi:hypothetical protein D3C76_1830010 [compost metagenome]
MPGHAVEQYGPHSATYCIGLASQSNRIGSLPQYLGALSERVEGCILEGIDDSVNIGENIIITTGVRPVD